MRTDFNVMNIEEAQIKAESILNMMTLDEKLSYIGGDKIFFIRGIDRLGLSPIYFVDATMGINIRHTAEEYDISDWAMEKSTAFPCAISLAATWNSKLSYQYAKSIGEECKAGGIGVLLGPGMNIYRQSQCGRNFEYFGEDPFLASRLVEQYVIGLQSTGTAATIKHFVANNTDFFRRKSNSVVDERTLHEIYMPAFKAGIDAGSKAVMTSYNLLNGEYCGQSDYVINYLLREQLGFSGLVMTDWWSVDNGEKLAKSGMDLEMPFTVALTNAKELLAEGKIEEKHIDRMVKQILQTCFEFGLYDKEKEPKFYETFQQHVDVALNTSREGIVLVRNENNLLPIRSSIKEILITGDYVTDFLNGGGAGAVEGYDKVSLLDALNNEFSERVKFVKNPTDVEIKNAEIVICNVGTVDHEGWDRPFDLPEDQESKVKFCVEHNPNTIVIVTSGSGIKMTEWNDRTAAILYSWYTGQIGNVAIAEILSGKTNPSGKLPMTIEKDFKDSPAEGYMRGEDFYTDWNSDEEAAHPIYDVNYDEGIFVGYRWYEYKNIEPLYPFGFGLSYSKFDIGEVSLSDTKINAEEELIVSIEISNISNIAGAEVIQLYIEDVESSVLRPIKELKGFAKVYLNPNETKNIEIRINKNHLSYWDPKRKAWYAEKGKFKLHIGNSSKNIKMIKEFELK